MFALGNFTCIYNLIAYGFNIVSILCTIVYIINIMFTVAYHSVRFTVYRTTTNINDHDSLKRDITTPVL
jgi:hypothetical protein